MPKRTKDPSLSTLSSILSPRSLPTGGRSRRVELRIPVHLRQEAREWLALAAVVNRGGGLLRSPEACAPGSQVRILNTETRESALFRIVWCNEIAPGQHEIGVAFVDPSPKYWGETYESVVVGDDTLPPRGRIVS